MSYPNSHYPQTANDTIEMGEYGTLSQYEFYKKYGISYNEEYDHNLLDIEKIHK